MVFTSDDIERLSKAPTEPARALDDEGIHPSLAALVEMPVKPLLKHLRKLRGYGAECGSYEGAIHVMPIGITCPECRKSRRVRK